MNEIKFKVLVEHLGCVCKYLKGDYCIRQREELEKYVNCDGNILMCEEENK